GRGHQDVDVLDRLAHAAKRARDLQPLDASVRAQGGGDLSRHAARGRQQRARAAGLVLLDRLQEVLARLLLDAGHADDAAAAAGFFEPFDGVDAEQLPERAGRARTEAANVEQAEEVRREVFAQPVEELEPPGRQVLLDAGGDLLADAGQRAQGAPRRDDGDVFAEGLQGLGRALPSADAEARFVAHLQEPRVLVDDPRQLEILPPCILPSRSGLSRARDPPRSPVIATWCWDLLEPYLRRNLINRGVERPTRKQVLEEFARVWPEV